MKKNILLISLYYPPIQSIASNRIEAITKYLDSNLFDIDVITLLENDASDVESKDNVTVYRIKDTSYLRPFRFNKKSSLLFHTLKVAWNITIKQLFPQYHGWKDNAEKYINILIQHKTYDIILSSYAPEAAHEVALKIKQQINAKWIADMRDEMSLNPFLSPVKRRKLALIEQKVIASCDMITSVSKPILDGFKTLAGEKSNRIQFIEIRNGYDFPLRTNASPKNGCFTISHVGSFYGERNPTNFLTALSLLNENHALPPIKIHFMGISKPLNLPENLRSFVNVSSLVSHHDALKTMEQSDALLLIHPSTSSKGVYTGKLFEYLGMLKPIIALVDKEDVAAQLIRETNAGYVADNSDIDGIQTILLETYNKWANNKIHSVNIDIISKHHRKEQIKRLENAIMELLS